VFVQHRYIASVLEEQEPPVAVVTVSATDFDDPTTQNVALTYVIPDGEADNKFVVNSSTGLVSTTSRLDRESKAAWTVTVYVQNAGFPSLSDITTVYVTVADVNDNAPVFVYSGAPLTLDVPENANMATIHTVEASDDDIGDNGLLTYSITGGNVDDKFYIDPDTGQLSCTPLDRELTAFYNLTITATDRAVSNPKSASMCIVVRVTDDNDNDPIFERTAYAASLAENVVPGTTVIRLSASDLDEGLNSNLSYSLSGAVDGMFDVDSQTGVITTIDWFDREDLSSYSFDATATDACPYGPRSRSVRVDVTVDDVNDNAPVFLQDVYSVNILVDFPVGGVVLTVTAVDKDIGPNAIITYSLSNTSIYFQIDRETGVITTRRVLDVSAVGPQTLKVTARDAGSPPLNTTCTVVISIQLVAPSTQLLRFVNETYTASVLEHASIGTFVLMVHANWNGSTTVLYSLANGDDIFSINDITGIIRVADSSKVDHEVSSRLRLIVLRQQQRVQRTSYMTTQQFG
jgi:protocadherin-16/23